MLYSKPDYYDQFQCTADQCEDTCCAGWQIVIDAKSLKRYHNEKSAFRSRLKKSIKWKDGIFKQSKDKRCAFLNEENLCDLYTALGKNSLCDTCRRYPRHIEEFENVRETTLSVSCPEVAKYLMKRKSPVTFMYEEDEKEEQYDDFDPFVYFTLDEGRNLLLNILQDRTESIYHRCERGMGLAAGIEDYINDSRMFECQDLFEQYEQKMETLPKRRLKRPMAFSSRLFQILFQMERLREDWDLFLTESAYLLYEKGEEYYDEIQKEYTQYTQQSEFDFEICFEQLMVYFVSTYFCGAVYDGRILAKVQMAVISIFLINELWKARWLKNDKQLHEEDLYEVVYRFSRELEHSDQNLIYLEKQAEKWKIR